MSPISSATPTNSRSNQVRQRRTQQSQARIEHVHKRAQALVKSQPVVTRAAPPRAELARFTRARAAMFAASIITTSMLPALKFASRQSR